MLTERKPSSDFSGYYTTCSPKKCTYQITRKMDYLYVVTTVAGIFGGLVLILRLLVPISVKFAYSIVSRYAHSRSSSDVELIENQLGKSTMRLNSYG
jgi:hypothetical protein